MKQPVKEDTLPSETRLITAHILPNHENLSVSIQTLGKTENHQECLPLEEIWNEQGEI